MSTAEYSTAHSILIVEDDAQMATELKAFLTGRGFRITVAKDGGQAQANFTMHRPDFVLLDLILPGESGYEICDRMKQIDEAVPIVVLSVIDMEDSRDLAFRVGANDYLTKPFDPDNLVDTIHEVSERVWQATHGDVKSSKDADRIRFKCSSCGKRLKVSNVHRGRAMTCPECGDALIVPRHN